MFIFYLILITSLVIFLQFVICQSDIKCPVIRTSKRN